MRTNDCFAFRHVKFSCIIFLGRRLFHQLLMAKEKTIYLNDDFLLVLQQLVTSLTCYSCTLCNSVDDNTYTEVVPDNAGFSCTVSDDNLHIDSRIYVSYLYNF